MWIVHLSEGVHQVSSTCAFTVPGYEGSALPGQLAVLCNIPSLGSPGFDPSHSSGGGRLMLMSLFGVSRASTGLTAPPAEMAEDLPFEHQAPRKPEAQGDLIPHLIQFLNFIE